MLGVSLTIAQHNIWPIEDETRKRFEHIPTDKFVKNRINLSLNVNTLSFCLCLIDSIEPIKCFYNKDNTIDDYLLLSNFLRKIKYEVDKYDSKTVITIFYYEAKKYLKEMNKQDIFEKWDKNIRGMGSFLDLSVYSDEERFYIEIQIGEKSGK